MGLGKEKIVGDSQADSMLACEQRKGFETKVGWSAGKVLFSGYGDYGSSLNFDSTQD
jgi:hypothetical protein